MSEPNHTPPTTLVHPIADWFLIGVFGLFCLVPGVILWWTMAGFAETTDETGVVHNPGIGQRMENQRAEGRKAKVKGTLRTAVKEDFGFRDELVHAAAVAQVNWLGVSSTPRVLMGQEGWLYINEPAETVDEIRGAAPLEDRLMRDIVATLAIYQLQSEQLQIPLVIIIPPSKPSIHPEYLPPWLKISPGKRRMDQFMALLPEIAPSLPVVDLRPAIIAEKERGAQTYQKTDTHWTDHGAFAAYEVFMPKVKALVPGATVLTRDDLEEALEERDSGGDLSIFLGLSAQLKEDLVRLHVKGKIEQVQEGASRYEITGGSGSGPKMVMYRDSFAYRLTPYMDASFGETLYRWPSAKGDPQGLINMQEVAELKPDILIIEFTERWFTINPKVMRVENAQTILHDLRQQAGQ